MRDQANQEDPIDEPPDPLAYDVASSMMQALAIAASPVVGSVLAPLVTPAVVAARRLDERAWARRMSNAAETVTACAAHLSISTEELVDLVGDDATRQALAGRVLSAAADTAQLKSKIVALGEVLALGLKDDAKIDEALLLASALASLEVPHVRVLSYVRDRNTSPKPSFALAEDLIGEFPGLKVGLASIVNTLVAGGMLVSRYLLPQAGKSGDGSKRNATPLEFGLGRRETDRFFEHPFEQWPISLSTDADGVVIRIPAQGDPPRQAQQALGCTVFGSSNLTGHLADRS